MPYQTNAELPESVKRHLPDHAQDIYRAAFNHA
jgi:cation transport regulator